MDLVKDTRTYEQDTDIVCLLDMSTCLIKTRFVLIGSDHGILTLVVLCIALTHLLVLTPSLTLLKLLVLTAVTLIIAGTNSRTVGYHVI